MFQTLAKKTINIEIDGSLILKILVISLVIAFLIFIFVGVPALVWVYVINTLSMGMSEKIVIFIVFYLVYLAIV